MIGSISFEEPKIVLTWLIRLRWFAIAGQIAAIAVAMATLGMQLHRAEIFFVVLITAGSNLGMIFLLNSRREFLAGMVPGVLVLDVILLTEMLFWTGGAENPFCTLYVVHVAIAVFVLGSGWAWAIGAAHSAPITRPRSFACRPNGIARMFFLPIASVRSIGGECRAVQ